MVAKSVEMIRSKYMPYVWCVRIMRGAGSSVYFRPTGSASIRRLMLALLNAEGTRRNG